MRGGKKIYFLLIKCSVVFVEFSPEAVIKFNFDLWWKNVQHIKKIISYKHISASEGAQ